MHDVVAFVKLSRLHFLAGGFLMFTLGVLATDASISLANYLVAQTAVTLAQITAHYVNEYADYEADLMIVNRTSFSGGSGVLVSGILPRVVALRAAAVTTALCIATSAALTTVSILATIAVLACLSVSWAYSMPPVRLLNTGWGELATALTVAALVPFTGALTAAGSIPAALWWMSGALCLVQMAMLLTFELPDLATDAAAGKRVLGTRIGFRNTTWLIVLCLVLAAVMVGSGGIAGQLEATAALLSTVALVPAIGLCIALRRSQHALTTFCGVATFFLCGSAFVLSYA